MKKFFLTVLLLPLLWACEPRITDRYPVLRTFEKDNILFTFYLTTEGGEMATVFNQGEKIKISYTRENLSSDTVYMADFYSNPIHQEGFCVIYNADNNEVVANPFIIATDDAPACYHMAPDQVMNSGFLFPDEYIDAVALEKGSYYVSFTPRFGYYQSCHHITNADEMIEIAVPEFRIDCEVK